MDDLKPNSDLIIYQNPDGTIKIDVRLEDETVWLTQAHMAELFGKSKKTISEHIQNIFQEGELDQVVVIRKFRTTSQHGAIEGKTQSNEVQFYNNLNGRELLQHAGTISHEMALEKTDIEYQKYKETQKLLKHEESLKELENDLKQLNEIQQRN